MTLRFLTASFESHLPARQISSDAARKEVHELALHCISLFEHLGVAAVTRSPAPNTR
eukprot:m.88077 g.88077  ORF g.88077 m.88077 type:complete len:57 (-) comp8483_c0_seq1:98-268(-)